MPGVSASITAVGVVDLDLGSSGTTLTMSPTDTDLFIGVSGTYSGLTFKVEGSRSGSVFYDIATYTSDDIGPLAAPVSPSDNSSVAYKGDVRAFTQLKITVLSLSSGTVSMEVMTGGFFPQRSGALLSGALAQLIYEMRATRGVLSSWLGGPSGPLFNIPSNEIGTSVGGSYPTNI